MQRGFEYNSDTSIVETNITTSTNPRETLKMVPFAFAIFVLYSRVFSVFHESISKSASSASSTWSAISETAILTNFGLVMRMEVVGSKEGEEGGGKRTVRTTTITTFYLPPFLLWPAQKSVE